MPSVVSFPEPGIYFGLPDEIYHAVPALSASGVKRMVASPMIFWATTPWLNPNPEEEEDSSFKELGKAYHARICEGREAFYERYAPYLIVDEYPHALHTQDDLRAKITELNAALPKEEQIKKSGTKAEMIERIRAADPDAIFWDDILEAHAAAHKGKKLIMPKQIHRIEIAAAMIEKHPQLKYAFDGGYPEVSIFWVKEGVNMKMRADYLKVKSVVDFKTFGNQREKPVNKAVAYSVAERKYHIQVATYQEGIAAAKELLREQGMACVHGAALPDERWIDAFMKAPDPEFLFVFQQTGVAPITRGKYFPRGLVYDIGKITLRDQREIYRKCLETYGTDPWLDIEEIDTFQDEEFPAFISD